LRDVGRVFFSLRPRPEEFSTREVAVELRHCFSHFVIIGQQTASRARSCGKDHRPNSQRGTRIRFASGESIPLRTNSRRAPKSAGGSG